MSAPGASWQDRRRGRPASASAPAVTLEIDALALHGVSPVDAGPLAAALQDVLARLAAADPPGRLAAPGAGSIAAPPYHPGAAEEGGRAIAAALWAGLRGRGPSP